MADRHRRRSSSIGALLIAALEQGISLGCAQAPSSGEGAPGSDNKNVGEASSGQDGGPGSGDSDRPATLASDVGPDGAPRVDGSEGDANSALASSSGSSGGTQGNGGSSPTMLPAVQGSCPTFHTGSNTLTLGANSISVTAWVGNPSTPSGGPLVIYWHGTGSSGQEAVLGLGQAGIDEIVRMGGMVAAPEASSRAPQGGYTGSNTGDNVWYTGDADYADMVVGCAVRQLHVDTRHIHVAGLSAGALQTVYMWYARSGYVASVVSYSGGADFLNQPPLQDPSNLAPAIAAHGAQGADVVGIDFAQASASWEAVIKRGGGFSIDCNDGADHFNGLTARLTHLAPSTVQFFKTHPFKVRPEPYAGGLPAGFPNYCTID